MLEHKALECSNWWNTKNATSAHFPRSWISFSFGKTRLKYFIRVFLKTLVFVLGYSMEKFLNFLFVSESWCTSIKKTLPLVLKKVVLQRHHISIPTSSIPSIEVAIDRTTLAENHLLKSALLCSLHQNPDRPQILRKWYEIWFILIFELTLFGNHRFDFVHWLCSLENFILSAEV